MARVDRCELEKSTTGSSVAGLDGLYRLYAGWLGGVLRRRLGRDGHLAEDMVHEAYIRVARYDAEDAGRHPKALLRQIAINLARDHMRRNVIRGGLVADGLDDAAALPGLSAPAEQEAELLLKQLVLGLPKKLRDVFLLSRFTQMTYDEIARHLGISVKAVEWRMSKALARLAEQLRD
ncbi:hypothetical protein ACFB49_22050 [Sphingomonas sp. DBB INV C78]|uniref:RNA polymerase sigma factor n=1 Tax=Sphingomonas sp. DBB INV C78 TaxID=3349434 RepID=UPI0036D2284B